MEQKVDSLNLYKQTLAKRIWALPSISEKEKEILYRQLLNDLDQFETDLNKSKEDLLARERFVGEENNLLRSLMGVDKDELRARQVTVGQELQLTKKSEEELKKENEAIKKRLSDLEQENDALRQHARQTEEKINEVKAQHLLIREEDIKAFGETHSGLKKQLKDLEFRLGSMRELFQQTNQKLVIEKQDEITDLQKKLLEEMEQTLFQRQNLLWAEEEAFARGVAHKVRSALVSAQGQLYLTLERLGLLEPDTHSESFWKSRLTLLIEGGDQLAENFKVVQTQLAEVTSALDHYLHLTHRKELEWRPVSLKELVQKEVADLYVDRRPTLQVEVLSDDPMPDVSADPEFMQFVIHTLIQNALEALPHQAGHITVSLKNRSREGLVSLVVMDEGCGVPDHLISRLFEPFFTTKEGRQGLSLSRARRYAELMGGTLELIKTSPEGSTFEVQLRLERK